MVIWEAILDPHRDPRGARRSGRRSERCMAVWEVVLDLHRGLRGARRSGRRHEVHGGLIGT